MSNNLPFGTVVSSSMDNSSPSIGPWLEDLTFLVTEGVDLDDNIPGTRLFITHPRMVCNRLFEFFSFSFSSSFVLAAPETLSQKKQGKRA